MAQDKQTRADEKDFRRGAGDARMENLPGLSTAALEFIRAKPLAAQRVAIAALENTVVKLRRQRHDRSGRSRGNTVVLSPAVLEKVRAEQRSEPVAGPRETDAGEVNPTAGVPSQLLPYLEARRSGANLIGASKAAERLDLSRTTVYDWVERKVLLAWRSTKRRLYIPSEQILGPGKVVPGIPEVLEIIEDPELAWAFLSSDWPFADGVARPIDHLKAGRADDVLNAAPSFGTAFT